MPRIDSPTSEFSAPVHRACGYRWTDDDACTGSGAHLCWRTSREHRSHMCACEAVELRSAHGPSIRAVAS